VSRAPPPQVNDSMKFWANWLTGFRLTDFRLTGFWLMKFWAYGPTIGWFVVSMANGPPAQKQLTADEISDGRKIEFLKSRRAITLGQIQNSVTGQKCSRAPQIAHEL